MEYLSFTNYLNLKLEGFQEHGNRYFNFLLNDLNNDKQEWTLFIFTLNVGVYLFVCLFTVKHYEIVDKFNVFFIY